MRIDRVRRTLATTVLLMLLSGAAAAGHFIPYPGASRYIPHNTEANRQWTDALRPGISITAWLSEDTFEQVLGFYRAVGREFKPPNGLPAEKLPSGQVIQKSFVILDGAPDRATSRHWIRIQRPFIAAARTQGAPQQYQDVRDVTEIVLTEWKPVPKHQGANPQLHEP
jgi:hypothetical protein